MKNKQRTVAAIAATECVFAAMACVMLMNACSPESGENVGVIMLLLSLCLVANVVCAFVDFFKAVSIISFALSVVSFFVILCGRVGYFVFFFCGDIMGTGLSLYLILALVFMLAASVCGGFQVAAPKNEKEKL